MKPARLVKKVWADLDVLQFPKAHVMPGGLPCPNCSSLLSMHQPDPDSPERMLGICETCKRWFLIDLMTYPSEGLMVGLPDIEVVRDLSHLDPQGGISLLGPT